MKLLDYPGLTIEKFDDGTVTVSLFDQYVEFTNEEFLFMMKDLNGNIAHDARMERERPSPVAVA
jgi:hypothetical protein